MNKLKVHSVTNLTQTTTRQNKHFLPLVNEFLIPKHHIHKFCTCQHFMIHSIYSVSYGYTLCCKSLLQLSTLTFIAFEPHQFSKHTAIREDSPGSVKGKTERRSAYILYYVYITGTWCDKKHISVVEIALSCKWFGEKTRFSQH